MFTHAITRLPGVNFAKGLTRVDRGPPSFEMALAQHAAYCDALRACGLQIITLDSDPAYPDGTFVEDTAILLPREAMLTRPGAPSRRGEVATIHSPLTAHFERMATITEPGCVDGGDICVTARDVFIGRSDRTDGEGARQLANWLRTQGHSPVEVDIRGVNSILHLKSGLADLGEGRLLVIDELIDHPAFAKYQRQPIAAAEAYAANALRIDERVLVASGYPMLSRELTRMGLEVIELHMSEFAKMDGGLSCLSLRW